VTRFLILAAGLGMIVAVGSAQPPAGDKQDDRKNAKGGSTNSTFVDDFVARMMAFDKNKDGKLTRDEITDERLLRLFDQADTNHDGVVTKEELAALAAKMTAYEPRGGPGGRPGGGPGGAGGRGGPGGGPGSPG